MYRYITTVPNKTGTWKYGVWGRVKHCGDILLLVITLVAYTGTS